VVAIPAEEFGVDLRAMKTMVKDLPPSDLDEPILVFGEERRRNGR